MVISLCPPLDTFVLVQPQVDLPEGFQNIRPFKHDSRQALSSPAGHSDGIVCASGDFKQICLLWPYPQIDLFTTRYKLPQYLQTQMPKPGQFTL